MHDKSFTSVRRVSLLLVEENPNGWQINVFPSLNHAKKQREHHHHHELRLIPNVYYYHHENCMLKENNCHPDYFGGETGLPVVSIQLLSVFLNREEGKIDLN